MQEASGCLSSMFNTMGVSRQNGIFGPSVMFATPMDESQWLILTKSRNTLGSGPLHEVHLKQLLGAMRLNPKSFTDFVVLSREQKFPNIPDQENFDGSCTPEGEIRASSKCCFDDLGVGGRTHQVCPIHHWLVNSHHNPHSCGLRQLPCKALSPIDMLYSLQKCCSLAGHLQIFCSA